MEAGASTTGNGDKRNLIKNIIRSKGNGGYFSYIVVYSRW